MANRKLTESGRGKGQKQAPKGTVSGPPATAAVPVRRPSARAAAFAHAASLAATAPIEIDLANPEARARRPVIDLSSPSADDIEAVRRDLDAPPVRPPGHWQRRGQQQDRAAVQPRGPLGQFLPCTSDEQRGAAETSGLRSKRVPPELLALQEAFLAASLVDEGGEADMPIRRRSLLQYRGILHRQILQLDLAFTSRGAYDRHGKMRTLWLTTLSQLIARAESLDKLLGLDRKQRQLPVPSPRDWVREADGGGTATEHEEVTCERG